MQLAHSEPRSTSFPANCPASWSWPLFSLFSPSEKKASSFRWQLCARSAQQATQLLQQAAVRPRRIRAFGFFIYRSARRRRDGLSCSTRGTSRLFECLEPPRGNKLVHTCVIQSETTHIICYEVHEQVEFLERKLRIKQLRRLFPISGRISEFVKHAQTYLVGL